ncbi:putative MFS family arabinose efflux permease [Variovorax boronicumulans]|uniref:MFS family arabinose efflux permease n=1 Tax=Variovorax boronicumulans TaxID=436515 RepID=A0AAW8D451_9BURK|nr:YbfB/YjiJ family MFS transporter [Variovorax boronicumulans]MDP9896226.1 putative MFS family arabinose efflux permease [Variovorax boronicumulans]MDQ0041460.1 putative MFS family arabinose efflux permease [Variovorax boronicumulans]MDQ0056161.1 putative MFS family arabinose efflux permease [Variovorax boronicumulans]
MSTTLTSPSLRAQPTLRLAFALSMGAAVSLGITRFAYALLLPPMRSDLGWSYALAGGMNTANAVGYLAGALVTPALMRRFGVTRLLIVGAVLASVFMAGSGFVTDAPALLLQRLLAGVASAWVFVAGGLLAARLGEADARTGASRSGLLLGIYYGGTGFGILLSALLVPQVLRAALDVPHGWTWAWWALALASAAATCLLTWAGRAMPDSPVSATPSAATATETAPISLRHFGWALAGYALFGMGYIGYMTFVIALLREQGASAGFVTLFYALLGIACVASSRLWAGLLDRYRGGQPQALLNGLLGVATLLPVLSASAPVALASGVLFGGVFLSVVASTTALVRHNLPPARWAQGISLFTIVFALGQIVGPTVTGWISDGPGGLARGLVASAIALWLGAVLASRQHALKEIG